MDQKKTGSFIAARRKDSSLTQSQLAEALGITNKAVSKWETGKSMPDLSLFCPLCELLHITLNELLSGEFISDENLKEKSNQILLEVVTAWLGKDQWEYKTDAHIPAVLKMSHIPYIHPFQIPPGSPCKAVQLIHICSFSVCHAVSREKAGNMKRD